MRSTLLLLFLCSISWLSAQRNYDCDQLAIVYHGIVATDNGNQLFFEVSNVSYTGTLYNYPGFLLIDERGDTIAREETTYYGIGMNFQTHLLNIEDGFSLPFKGNLELWGSFYQHSYCSFPLEIEHSEMVERADFEEEPVKVTTNFAGDQLIVDLGGAYYDEDITYRIEIIDQDGKLSYSEKLETSVQAVPVNKIIGRGGYIVTIVDDTGKVVLAGEPFYLE